MHDWKSRAPLGPDFNKEVVTISNKVATNTKEVTVMEVDMVANMEVDMVADMEVDLMAKMEVDNWTWQSFER